VREQTAALASGWSLLSRRIQPELPLMITEGWWRALHFDLRAGNIDATWSWWGRNPTHPMDRHICTTIALDDTLHIGPARFSSSPMLRVSAMISRASGIVPPQRMVVLPGRSWAIAPKNAFRSVAYREFVGEKLLSVLLDFNARDLPFRLLGLERTVVGCLDATAHAGIGTVRAERRSVIAEWGAGLAGFAGLFRIEITRQWRPHARTVLNFGATVDW
jgi:hypothetical protein